MSFGEVINDAAATWPEIGAAVTAAALAMSILALLFLIVTRVRLKKLERRVNELDAQADSLMGERIRNANLETRVRQIEERI